MVKVKLTKEPGAGKYIITAFPTVGYVSLLVTKYLEEKKFIKDIGYIDLEPTMPVAVISTGSLKFPIRVFEGSSFIIVTSEVPIQQSEVDKLVDMIISLYKKYKAKGIITIDGIMAEKGKEASDVYYVSTAGHEIESAKRLNDGAMFGLNAGVALKAVSQDIDALILMSETHYEIPDGLAAASLLNALAGVIGIKVDTKELVTEYKKTLSKINELLKKVSQNGEKKSEIYG